MSGPFFGFYENAVHNQRVIIPAIFKRKFSDESLRTVIITAGPLNSIALFPLDNWAATLARLAQGNADEQRLRTRLIDCAVTEAELEGPGRIRIPEHQLLESGIQESVIVKGEDHYITLWNPQSFYAKLKQDRESTNKEYDTNSYQVFK